MATVRNVYVDTDCAGTGDGSGFGANCKYTSLNQAEQAEDDTGNLTTTDEYVVFHCRGVTNADTAAVSVNGWTTDATRYIQIQCDSGDGHAGVWTTSKYQLLTANATSLAIDEDYVMVTGLQVGKSSSSASAQVNIAIVTALSNGANAIKISACILKQAGNDSYNEQNINISGATYANVYVWNCIMYGHGANNTGSNACVLVNTATATVNIYSSDLIGNASGGYGINNASGTVTMKNCYARGITGSQAYQGTITKTTCASSDTTGSVGLQNIAYSTSSGAYFTNVSAGSEDLRISSASSALVNAGTDTSGESAPLNFTVDIKGVTRG